MNKREFGTELTNKIAQRKELLEQWKKEKSQKQVFVLVQQTLIHKNTHTHTIVHILEV